MKLGMLLRMDNSGLGTLSWEFARHMKPHKAILIEHDTHINFPERYKDIDTKIIQKNVSINSIDLHEKIEWLLRDIDVLFSCETFYDGGIIKMAKTMGVKTVLYTMFEMSPEVFPYYPDMLLCPSKLDFDTFKDAPTRVEYLPVPVATDRLIWKKRDKAKVFIHSASHGGVGGRKGTKLFMDAIDLVKSDVKFKIFTWESKFRSKDPRVEVKLVNFKNYWQIWREGDVLVYPQDYNGICLPIIEAMTSGLGVITTNIYPFNEYMPKELLFEPSSMYKTQASRGLIVVDAAKIDPQVIADKIDEVARMDISKFSEYGKDWGAKNSWLTLLPDYIKVMSSL